MLRYRDHRNAKTEVTGRVRFSLSNGGDLIVEREVLGMIPAVDANGVEVYNHHTFWRRVSSDETPDLIRLGILTPDVSEE